MQFHKRDRVGKGLLECAGFLLALSIAACSSQGLQKDQYTDQGGKKKDTSEQITTTQQERNANTQLLKIPLNFTESQAVPASVSTKNATSLALTGHTGLGLATAATHFSIELTGCVSGYTSTGDEVNPSLNVYKYDQGCIAKLVSFELPSGIFTPTGGTDFSSWDAGQTAVFAKTTDNTVTMGVVVIAQLPSTITGTEAVTYSFYEIVEGADVAVSDVGEGHTMTVDGVLAPSFTVNSVRYVAMTNTGAGQFEFTMHCSVALGNANTTCKDVTLTDIDYMLIEDAAPYNGTITFAQADALDWDNDSTPVVGGEVVNVGGNDAATPPNTLARGGFYTNIAAPLTGPDELHNNPNMLLIFRAPNGDHASYLYFNVDVTTLTQP